LNFLGGAVRVALAIFWSGWIGHRVARPLLSRLSGEERIAWGFGIGLLLQAALYSILLLFGLEPGPILMLLPGLALAIALAIRSRGTRVRADLEPLPPAAVGLLVLTGIAWVLFLLSSAVEPMWANDYLAIWGLKAKTISLSSAIPPRLFHDAATAWSHPEYPLLLPLFLASLSALAGEWNDHALALLFPALSAALLLALSGFFRRRRHLLGGAIAALLVSLFFFLFQAFEVGMAEIPLAFALLLVALSANDRDEDPGKLGATAGTGWRVAIAGLLCCGLKQEGTLFVLLLAAGIALRGIVDRRRRLASTPAFLLVPAALNWGILRILRGPLADRDFDLSYLNPGKIPLLFHRLSTVWAAVLRFQLLPVAIPAGALLLFLLLTPRSRLDWLLPVLGAQLFVYVSVCAFSSFDPRWQAQFVPRIAGALFPVLCAVVGERSALLFEDGGVEAANRVKVRQE
jgi:hypothetical protein